MKCQFEGCILNRGHTGDHLVVWESDEYEGDVQFLWEDDDHSCSGALTHEQVHKMLSQSCIIADNL